MFGKTKKEISSTSIVTTGSTTTSSQYATFVSASGSITEQRTVSLRTTSSHMSSSVITSNQKIRTSVGETNSSGISIRPSRDRIKPALDVDAMPFSLTNTTLAKSPLSNNVGYQSPFSRKLKPIMTSDAIPSPIRAVSSPSSANRISDESTQFSRNLPSYVSYRSQPTSVSSLPTAASTHSLPSSLEQSQRDPRIPTYDTIGKKRGKVLVINNIKFLMKNEERKGAETDEKNINKLFTTMGFDVDVFRDLKHSGMLEKVKKFKNDSSLKKVDISIVIMMSHGNNMDKTGRVIGGGFTQIFGIDDEGLSIEDVLNQFSAESCPAMAGKPKIFIFQCCRGDISETLHIDATPMKNVVKKHGDMLIAFSTLPGFYSLRDTVQGSWYIQCICEVFKNYAKEFDVEQLLKIVDDQLSKKHPTYKQTSMYESRGFKRCYLNPK